MKRTVSVILTVLVLLMSVPFSLSAEAGEENSVQVEGGGTYNSLEAALNAASNGDKITLKKDIVTGVVEIDKNVTLDLCGKTLTADGIVAFGELILADSATKKGLLNIPKGAICAISVDPVSSNKTLLYKNDDDDAKSGYVISDTVIQDEFEEKPNLKGFYLKFRPSFNESREFNIEMLSNGGKAADIQIIVQLVDSDGQKIKECIYDDYYIKRVYSETKAFTLQVSNIPDGYGTVKVKYIINSESHGMSCEVDMVS